MNYQTNKLETALELARRDKEEALQRCITEPHAKGLSADLDAAIQNHKIAIKEWRGSR